MSFTIGILFLMVMYKVSSSATVTMQQAAIQAMPPSVSLTPLADKQNSGNFININPFLTSSLLQDLVEESENKKRVQRYRDVASSK